MYSALPKSDGLPETLERVQFVKAVQLDFEKNAVVCGWSS